MSVLAHPADFADRRAPRAIRKPSVLRRFLQWRQRQAEHAIAVHLGLTGGRITDEIERRMTERLTSGSGFRS